MLALRAALFTAEKNEEGIVSLHSLFKTALKKKIHCLFLYLCFYRDIISGNAFDDDDDENNGDAMPAH